MFAKDLYTFDCKFINPDDSKHKGKISVSVKIPNYIDLLPSTVYGNGSFNKKNWQLECPGNSNAVSLTKINTWLGHAGWT